jgi:hypothetical protein
MTNPRTRLAAVAGSTALAMSIMATPALAQDDPTDTVQGFMDAIVAKDFEAMPSFFCEAEAEQAAQFDVSALAGEMPPGLDVQSLLDAFIFDVQLETLDVVSQTDDEAVVQVVGSMAMDIDPDALVPFVEAVIEMSGQEADEETIQLFMGLIASEFEAQAEDIDGEVTLVPGEDMAWLICSDLDFGSDDLADDDMTADDDMADDDMADEETEDEGE